jgi:hypothetical protein
MEGELSLSDVLKRRLAVWIHEPSKVYARAECNWSKLLKGSGLVQDARRPWSASNKKKKNEGKKKLTPRLPSARGENDAHNQTIKGKSFSENKDQNHPNKQLWLLRIRPAKESKGFKLDTGGVTFEFTNACQWDGQ